MNVLIIEDELLAAEKIIHYLEKYSDSYTVAAHLYGIEEASSWLDQKQEEIDLIFMDIQLQDGLSFEIFNRVKVNKPVIFATAFDEYAIDAFKSNGIDYVLKPVTFIALSAALKKFEGLKAQFSQPAAINTVINEIESSRYKSRFLVKLGNHIHSVKTENVNLFYAEGRTAYLVTDQSKKYIVDYRLEDLNSLLNPHNFFRVNRSFILNINAIEDVMVYSNNRLKIKTFASVESEIIVSREKVNAFKQWFEGE
ncbi:LytR/AlgR family response regulator transcription factor [Spongiivirga citrea]|uniref:Response regulator n=1 Tax=Spongiivirga citrea TaxID=1481457 RepID=A0A6M0CF52_9FLAO|nr:LytTR family DNA-binding domain-containing protein [Spongiivirga citrea]NER16401.1 response regulator [Spongiivirga citrea]